MLKRGLPPLHPGEIVLANIEGLRSETGQALPLTEIAAGLGVRYNRLLRLIHQKAGISAEMALRLSVAFGTSAQFWLNVQRNYDLWHAEQAVQRESIKHFWPLPEAGLQPV